MEQEDPRHLLVKVADILDKLKISYLITGGMAVLVWGRPRFTADIDIVVELKLKDVEDLVRLLSQLGRASYIDKEMIKDALKNEGEFNFIHGETGLKVDFWILKKEPFELNRMKRRVTKNILGRRIYFISPEDLILSKLLWYKQGASVKHLEDVKSIFRISGQKIDMDYLKNWAGELKVLSELNKLRE